MTSVNGVLLMAKLTSMSIGIKATGTCGAHVQHSVLNGGFRFALGSESGGSG